MQFVYGSYHHDKNSVAFESMNRELVYSQGGRPQYFKVTMAMKGKIVRPTQGEVIAQLAALQQAYSVNGMTCMMLDNSGSSIDAWAMYTNDSLGGVIVKVAPSHGPITGAEGATYLNYRFVLEGDFPVRAGGYLTFSETLSFSSNNGEPIQVERIPAQGSPILQNVTEKSWYRATQTGSLTQQSSGVYPVAPIWPERLRGQEGSSVVTFTSPKTIRGRPFEWGVQWKYDFVSPEPLFGNVHAFG